MACTVVKRFRKKTNAKKFAKARRNRGLKARVCKAGKRGWAVSTC